MSYAERVKAFLAKVDEIKRLQPTYRQPGDGSDGTCDCIGLIIGAIRRMGLRWTGIHGSNWAARREVVKLKKITSPSVLSVGDAVFKAYDQGDAKNTLPSRYKKGGSYYNGDLKDYYHVGVVTQVNPLRITHMTSPTVRVDVSIGKWSYYGQLKLLQPEQSTLPPQSSSGNTVPTTGTTSGISHSDTIPVGTPTAGGYAIVTAESGKYVKMRQYPSTSCRLWVNIPIGTKVEIVSPGEEWARINYGFRKGWYMMAKFLKV